MTAFKDFVIRRKNLVAFICAVVLVCFFCGFLQYFNHRERQAILHSKAFSTGSIYKIQTLKSRGTVAYYSFKIGESYVSGEGTNARYHDIGPIIFQKFFPVIYNSKDPSKNQILIFPDEFSKYDLPFPDSLNWIIAIEQK